MFSKKLSKSMLAATILSTSSLVSAQSVDALQSITEDAGLNSSTLFNILPGNPLVIGYSLLTDGPQEAVVVGDLLQGNLIINHVLAGLPGGDVIRAVYIENIKSSAPATPLEGLIDSQL